MQTNGMKTKYPYEAPLSPRPLYDFASPTSNYPSYMGGASPGFDAMAYQQTPRYGSSAFIPPPDVFLDGRKGSMPFTNAETPRESRQRASEILNGDPVAVHLLVETAIDDSQNYEILSVEEMEALKKEQQILIPRIEALRKKLERETKVRDAAANLGRLSLNKGHMRNASSRGNNSMTNGMSDDEVNASSRRCEEIYRELAEVESRAKSIQMQLLMHTAGILQMTYNGPSKRTSSQLPDGVDRRPDSPVSLYTYDTRNNRTKAEDVFDDRSLYRSPENLDILMNALKNGTHLHTESVPQQSDALVAVEKRLEDLNDRLRALIIEANPDRNRDYSLPPKVAGPSDSSTVEQQLDFLDQGLRDIGAEQDNLKDRSRHLSNAVEGRLEGINNQLYTMLNRSQNERNERFLPPPPITGSGSQDQLNYMEENFSNIEQLQFSMEDEIDALRSQPVMNKVNNQDSQYETTLLGLWSIIQAGEEQARERKAERRRLVASDPNADDDLSPDEDDGGMEEFSLGAFSTKVQWLYSRATSLKEKEAILRRQIKQQRELNSRSDAQKEAEFARLNDLVEKAYSEKAVVEQELDRAINQLKQFDQQRNGLESEALRDAQDRYKTVESQLDAAHEALDRSGAAESQLRAALQDAQDRYQTVESQLNAAHEALDRSGAVESQLRDALQDAQDRYQTVESQLKAVHEALDRSEAMESQLREAQDDVRIEALETKAELSETLAKIEELAASLRAATAQKDAAEARTTEANNALNAKEEELRQLEGEVVRLTTELTFAKAELDGAYGTRAERAAEVAANPTIKRELEELAAKNSILAAELEGLRKAQESASQSENHAREAERTLKQELSAMATDYEVLTRESIQNEKERDNYEAMIDALRDEKEKLEMELSDERVKWLGVRSPGPSNTQLPMEATSIRMLREDFRKMMRDRTAEGLKALRHEQEERRKLEALIRSLKKETSPPKSNLSKTMLA